MGQVVDFLQLFFRRNIAFYFLLGSTHFFKLFKELFEINLSELALLNMRIRVDLTNTFLDEVNGARLALFFK